MVSINFICLPILAKSIFVKFEPPIDKLVVREMLSLRPFKAKKNQNQTGYVGYNTYLIFIFSYFLIAKTVQVANSFTCYV